MNIIEFFESPNEDDLRTMILDQIDDARRAATQYRVVLALSLREAVAEYDKDEALWPSVNRLRDRVLQIADMVAPRPANVDGEPA